MPVFDIDRRRDSDYESLCPRCARSIWIVPSTVKITFSELNGTAESSQNPPSHSDDQRACRQRARRRLTNPQVRALNDNIGNDWRSGTGGGRTC